MVDQQSRKSNGKVKIEGYMRVSGEQAHHRAILCQKSGSSEMSLAILFALAFALASLVTTILFTGCFVASCVMKMLS